MQTGAVGDLSWSTSQVRTALLGHQPNIPSPLFVLPALLSGMVVAPMALVFELARLAVRPAVLGLGIHAARRWVRRHALSAERLLRQVSAADVAARLEALRRIVARLATSLAFTKQFKR